MPDKDENSVSELPSTMTEAELDKLLKQEASAFSKEMEVERILKAFKLNPYDVLDIPYNSNADEIKKRFRQLSLFIHPDKTPHPKAPDAFDLLKKAESDLSNSEKREELDAVVEAARSQILAANKLPTNLRDETDERLIELNPPWKEQVKKRVREILIEEEVRRRRAVKMNLANEGLEARKKEEEQAAKKRKVEDDAHWEQNRETRVDSWRSFQQGNKKKKKKPNVLG